ASRHRHSGATVSRWRTSASAQGSQSPAAGVAECNRIPAWYRRPVLSTSTPLRGAAVRTGTCETRRSRLQLGPLCRPASRIAFHRDWGVTLLPFFLLLLLRQGRRSPDGFHDFRWQPKTYVFRHHFDFTQVGKALLLQERHGFLHQYLRRRCACRQSHGFDGRRRSEEHTSELQSLTNLVCR